MQLPYKQVVLMRDIRMKQIEQQQKNAEKELAAKPPANAGGLPNIPTTGLSDLIDELS